MKLTERELENKKVFYSCEVTGNMFTTIHEAEEDAEANGDRYIIKFVKDRFGCWNDDKYITI